MITYVFCLNSWFIDVYKHFFAKTPSWFNERHFSTESYYYSSLSFFILDIQDILVTQQYGTQIIWGPHSC